jgi:hypothetical protein
MNKQIADGFLQEIAERINPDNPDVWGLVIISDAVGKCWPEWGIRYKYFGNESSTLNHQGKPDSDFDELNKRHATELINFLNTI